MPLLKPIVLSLALIGLATPAGAVTFQLEIFQEGSSIGSVGTAGLGCVDVSPGGPTANCIGGGATVGDLLLDNWNFFVDEDPVVSGVVGLTNLAATTQQFTLLFTLPIVPPILGGSVIGGSIQGGGTDNNGNGVTVATAAGSAFYTALIDGSSVQTLYDDPQSFSAGAFLSTNIPSLAFGTPIPSQAGPPALASIAIQLDFTLTAGDSATFSSVFVVEPVPEPALGGLLLSAGLLLVARHRTR